MKLLAWDTSSKVGTIVALEWDARAKIGWSGVKLVSEWTLNVDSTHSEGLMWAIHQVLEGAQWKPEDVDVFGVGVGPGSFTGLRIGVATAKTMAGELKKPLVPVSSLSALARPAALWLAQETETTKKIAKTKGTKERRPRTVLIASSDAAKGELYALWGSARSVVDCVSMAENDQPGLWKRGVEEEVGGVEVLGRAFKRKMSEGGLESAWAVVGEGRHRYPELWKSLPAERRIEVPQVFSDYVQGRYLGMLCWEGIQAGVLRQAEEISPRYLRASDAEVKLKAGLLPPGPKRGN